MKNIIILSSVLFSLACNEKEEKIIIDNKEKKTVSIANIKNQSYSISCNANQVNFEILVNDIPAYRYFYKVNEALARVKLSLPINHLINKGQNIIIGNIYPANKEFLGNNAFLGLEFKIREANTLDYKTISEVTSPDLYIEDNNLVNPIAKLPFYKLAYELEADLPFDVVGWRKSVNLKKEAEDGADIWRETKNFYHKIYNIIQTKNTAEFTQMIKEREALLATVFYFTQDKQKQDLKDFLELIENNNFELAPLPEKPILHYYGYGNLVTMLTVNREGIIKLVNKKNPKEEIILDFYFHRKTKGGSLEVIL